jgi:hypothetical protein
MNTSSEGNFVYIRPSEDGTGEWWSKLNNDEFTIDSENLFLYPSADKSGQWWYDGKEVYPQSHSHLEYIHNK